MDTNEILYRYEVKQSDMDDFEELLTSSGFFYDFEIECAFDFLKMRLEDGEESGVNYIMAEKDDKLIGFICYGFDPCTLSTHLLYWMGIHEKHRGAGIGSVLVAKFEEDVIGKGAKKIVLETAGRELYRPTREFYIKNGYREEGIVPDYYSVGDARVTYVKDVG